MAAALKRAKKNADKREKEAAKRQKQWEYK
jgi:hypothetical protein